MSDSWDTGFSVEPNHSAPREWTNKTYSRGGGGRGRGQRNNRGGNNWDEEGGGQSNSFQNDRGNWRQRSNDGNQSSESRKNGFSRGPRENNSDFSNSDVTTIEVPSTVVGRVIGRGGSKIRELESETSASIKVIRNYDNEPVTKIELRGTTEAVEDAKSKIESLTVERDSNSYKRYPKNNTDTSDNGWNSSASNQNKWQESENSEDNNKWPSSNYTNTEKDSKKSYSENKWSTARCAEPEEDSKKSFGEINWQEVYQKCQEETRAYWAKLPQIRKNFYEEHPSVSSFSDDEVEDIRFKNNNISISYVFGSEPDSPKVPNPVVTFDQAFHQYPEILIGIEKMGFEKPSPIQLQAWPVLLRGQDLIGIAQTGTGKTLAFLLPALIHIEGQITPRVERKGPTVLILAPTRELAQQIEKEVQKYNYKDIRAVCLYGGGSRKEQIDICTGGVEIVIATPGRLSDLTVNNHIDMKSVSYVVLDEADRMLDLGFEPQIRKIMLDIRPDRQTVMTSATWPSAVRDLAKSYMNNPIQICVGSLDLAAVHSVKQTIRILDDNDDVKYEELLNFIYNMGDDVKAIVFCGKKARVAHISSELALAGIDCQAMHGDLEQVDREQALLDIGDGSVKILIATDVAARGIDICDITHVINMDFPRNIEEYVHRVGRTGRAGKTGEAISFFTRNDWNNAKELISILSEAEQEIPDELYRMTERYEAFKQRKQESRGFGSRGGNRRGGFQRY